jgi:hypothetical protein
LKETTETPLVSLLVMRSQSAELHLSNLGAKFKHVLQLNRLFTVFNVYGTEVVAIRGFRPAAISA